VLDPLVERFVDWVRDYFVDDEDAAEMVTPQAQPVRPKPSPALDMHLLLLERARWLLEHDPFVQDARALFNGRLLVPHEAVDVLSSPLLARWDLSRWLRSGLPVHHVAEPVIELATREAYWREHMERSVAASWSVVEVRERADRCEVYRVSWSDGERLVDVPKRADVELVWAVPAWRWVQVPFRERASVPPHWQPWVRESGGRVVVLVELHVAVAGSPLALIYRAVARLSTRTRRAVAALWSGDVSPGGRMEKDVRLLGPLDELGRIDSPRRSPGRRRDRLVPESDRTSLQRGRAGHSFAPAGRRAHARPRGVVVRAGRAGRAVADLRSAPPGLERPLPGLALRARCLVLASAPQQRLVHLPGRPTLTHRTPPPPTRAAGPARCGIACGANTCSEADNWHHNWHQRQKTTRERIPTVSSVPRRDAVFCGAGGRIRTDDLLFTKQLLYR
jgi:hypothetical protein